MAGRSQLSHAFVSRPTDRHHQVATPSQVSVSSVGSPKGVDLHSIEGMAVILVFQGLSRVCEFEVCLNMGTFEKIPGGSPHAEVV